MGDKERRERYEKLIMDCCPAAAAIGWRELYHLTFLRKQKGILTSPKERRNGTGKE